MGLEMYKKILLPIDGTEISYSAAKHAARLAKAFDGEITLMYVIDVNALYEMEEGKIVSLEKAKRKGKKILESAKEKIKEHKLKTKFRVARGSPWNQIVMEAEKGAYDMIIMGACGKTAIKRILLGSTSESVVRNAPCTVTIIRDICPNDD